MSRFVLDCSVAVAWVIDEEATPATDSLLERLRDDGALVPALWRLEVANVLLQAERRERLGPAKITASLRLIDDLPIVTDPQTEARAFREILALARSESLTVYDASYLELAMRHDIALATQDQALILAARRLQVPTLPD